MANQSAPEEDCSCSDLIMYALLFMSVSQSGLKSCPSSNREKGLSLLLVNCWFKKKEKKCIAFVFYFLAFYHFAKFHIIFLHSLFCCIVAI